MNRWLRLHLFAIKSAFTHLRHSPGNFIFNVLVVAIALALPISGMTLIENIRPVSEELAIDPEISIFLLPNTPRAEATALSIQIKNLLKTASITGKLSFITKDKALATMEQKSSLAEVLSTLGGNPLPDAYILALSNTNAQQVEELASQFKKLPNVDVVQIDSAWIKRLSALLHIAKICVLFLGVTLSVVVIVVVFNATRLQVISHQAEINVTRLLGATNSFIRRPYYYTGALLGLLASVCAMSLVALGLQPLNQAIAEFARLYDSEFHLSPLGLIPSLLLILLSIFLGLCGTFLSVRRQLTRNQTI